MEGVVEDVLGAYALVLPGALAHADDELALVVEVDVGVVGGHVGEKVDGGVVIERGVHPVAEEVRGVIHARERDAPLEEVGTAQRVDHRVRGAHAASRGERAQVGVVDLVDEGDDLLAGVAVVRLLDVGAPDFVAPLLRPAVLVDGVDADELDAFLLDEVGEVLDHAEVLVVGAGGVLGGEDDDGVTCAAVDDDVHVTAEVFAPVGGEIAIHMGVRSSRGDLSHSPMVAFKHCGRVPRLWCGERANVSVQPTDRGGVS